jgi:hypothetical protein
MALTTKKRLAKRKLEIQEVRKENQTETSKKHHKTCLEFLERSTKDFLLKQLRVLKGKLLRLDKEKKKRKNSSTNLKLKMITKIRQTNV